MFFYIMAGGDTCQQSSGMSVNQKHNCDCKFYPTAHSSACWTCHIMHGPQTLHLMGVDFGIVWFFQQPVIDVLMSSQ